MVDRSGAELAEELLRAKRLQVGDEVRPEVEDVVAREAVPLLDDDGSAAEEGHLDGHPQSARARSDNQHLPSRPAP